MQSDLIVSIKLTVATTIFSSRQQLNESSCIHGFRLLLRKLALTWMIFAQTSLALQALLY